MRLVLRVVVGVVAGGVGCGVLAGLAGCNGVGQRAAAVARMRTVVSEDDRRFIMLLRVIAGDREPGFGDGRPAVPAYVAFAGGDWNTPPRYAWTVMDPYYSQAFAYRSLETVPIWPRVMVGDAERGSRDLVVLRYIGESITIDTSAAGIASARERLRLAIRSGADSNDLDRPLAAMIDERPDLDPGVLAWARALLEVTRPQGQSGV